MMPTKNYTVMVTAMTMKNGIRAMDEAKECPPKIKAAIVASFDFFEVLMMLKVVRGVA